MAAAKDTGNDVEAARVDQKTGIAERIEYDIYGEYVADATPFVTWHDGTLDGGMHWKKCVAFNKRCVRAAYPLRHPSTAAAADITLKGMLLTGYETDKYYGHVRRILPKSCGVIQFNRETAPRAAEFTGYLEGQSVRQTLAIRATLSADGLIASTVIDHVTKNGSIFVKAPSGYRIVSIEIENQSATDASFCYLTLCK